MVIVAHFSDAIAVAMWHMTAAVTERSFWGVAEAKVFSAFVDSSKAIHHNGSGVTLPYTFNVDDRVASLWRNVRRKGQL